MLSLEVSMISGLSKASSVMKIDMVKPMPPRNPAPMICLHETLSGRRERPSFTARQANRAMPNGLPAKSPAKMPRLLLEVSPPAQLSASVMPVLARAKSGMMTNATGLCRKCCSLWEGE